MSPESPLPLVSVIVPAWRHDDHARDVLQSIAGQDHEAVELVVVEAAQGRSLHKNRPEFERSATAARFRRVVFVDAVPGASRAEAINVGLREAQGDFVNVVEEGDVLAPNRFSRLLSVSHEPGAELAFGRVDVRAPRAGSNGSAAADSDAVFGLQDDIEFYPSVGFALLKAPCAIVTGNLFFSRRLAARLGGFGAYPVAYGWDFALRSLLVTEPAFVPEYLMTCRPAADRRLLVRRPSEGSPDAREIDAILRQYLFMCRNRRLENPVAPSPAWGPLFDSFLDELGYRQYLAKP